MTTDDVERGRSRQTPTERVTEEERPRQEDVNRAFRTILEGLRTTLPSSSTLFGFLLIVPFQAAFSSFDSVSRVAYYVAFLSAATSTALLVAPAAHQRIRTPMSGVRRRSKLHLMITVWITIVGTAAFALALAAGVFLVSRIVFEGTVAAVAAGGLTAVLVGVWFYLPVITFERIE